MTEDACLTTEKSAICLQAGFVRRLALGFTKCVLLIVRKLQMLIEEKSL